MRYVLSHCGVPVADVDALSLQGLRVTEWRPRPAFEPLGPIVAARWLALLSDPPGGHAGRQAALRRGAELTAALEIRDERGARVPTNGIELFLRGSTGLVVAVSFAESPAGVPAELRAPERSDRGGARDA